MSLKERITQDMKDAMRSADKERLGNIVRHQKRRCTRNQLWEFVIESCARDGVECSKRFIKQQE